MFVLIRACKITGRRSDFTLLGSAAAFFGNASCLTVRSAPQEASPRASRQGQQMNLRSGSSHKNTN